MPLYARALETRRPTAVFRDYHAASIVGQLAYDFAKFNDLAMHAAAVSARRSSMTWCARLSPHILTAW